MRSAKDKLHDAATEVVKLREVNAALVEALKNCHKISEGMRDGHKADRIRPMEGAVMIARCCESALAPARALARGEADKCPSMIPLACGCPECLAKIACGEAVQP